MGIKDDVLEVLRLQKDYSPSVTESMARRGSIIRQALPRGLSRIAEELRIGAGIRPGEFLLEGSDGQGRRSLVPWVRFSSRVRSPSATKGWYVVLLFREDGSGAYLGLAHASNESASGGFVSRSAAEATRLVKWARDLIGSDIRGDGRLSEEIELGQGKLGRSYESTTATSYFYPVDDIPSDEQIADDLRFMAVLLGKVYSADDAQIRTRETSLDVISVIEAVEETTTGRARAGQGFGLSPAERRAVELRAMAAAIDYFAGQGYSVEDTSATKSYDLMVKLGPATLYIEVKGTTCSLGDIVLTRNEVDHHLQQYPNNGLFVLSEVQLIRDSTQATAVGGVPFVSTPWQVEIDRLQPIAFRYRLS
ncbi:DUF3578 domain-containing protein [Stenotrophomonas sp. PS02289]|uniref:MrcB family domain-containing protein n=1 Tax=Stenotrophomonas sp. PS02289 TaxID=2991422 RepID=UPI00249A93D9|nr:DUF3578 domain-containing protein [Stenotrophomonas sp. PS02289]